MIRPTTPDDTPALVELARATAVFKPHEIDALREVLDDYHAAERARGHLAWTDERDGRAVGFVYHAPSSMADRAWYLYWIAVEVAGQGGGIGGGLLGRAEEDVREAGGRMLLVETSSTPHYGPTRGFYLKHGYEVACTLADFYADGDDMVVFRKRFLPRR